MQVTEISRHYYRLDWGDQLIYWDLRKSSSNADHEHGKFLKYTNLYIFIYTHTEINMFAKTHARTHTV